MGTPVSARLQRHPLLTAVVFTGTGSLPIFLVSAQILQLEAQIGFGVGELAIASATFMGASSLAAALAGRVVAQIGATRGFRMGTTLTLGSCLLAVSAGTAWLVPVATAVAGLGNGLIQVAANLTIFDGVTVARQGVAYGAKQAAVPTASLVAGLSLPAIGLALGWRWAFVGAAALALLLALSVPAFDMRPVEERAETARGRPPLALLPLALAGFAGAFGGNAAALFVVPSAVDVGISEAAAGVVLAGCSTLVVAVRIGAGWVVDRRSSTGHLEMLALTFTGAAGAFGLVAASAPSLYLAAMPIALLGAWGWPGIFFFTVVHSFPDIPARASGLVLAGNFTGTVLGPLAVGVFAARGDYPSAWLLVGTAAALSAAGFLAAYLLNSRKAPGQRSGRSMA